MLSGVVAAAVDETDAVLKWNAALPSRAGMVQGDQRRPLCQPQPPRPGCAPARAPYVHTSSSRDQVRDYHKNTVPCGRVELDHAELMPGS